MTAFTGIVQKSKTFQISHRQYDRQVQPTVDY